MAPEKEREGAGHQRVERGRLYLVLGGALGVVALATIGRGCLKSILSPESADEAGEYLGVWVGKRGDRLALRKCTDDPQPLPEIKMEDGVRLFLIQAIVTNQRYGGRGGIYRADDGRLALVLWCHPCQSNVVFGLKKEGEDIKIGFGKKDKHLSVSSVMKHAHQPSFHNRYHGDTWKTYRRPKK